MCYDFSSQLKSLKGNEAMKPDLKILAFVMMFFLFITNANAVASKIEFIPNPNEAPQITLQKAFGGSVSSSSAIDSTEDCTKDGLNHLNIVEDDLFPYALSITQHGDVDLDCNSKNLNDQLARSRYEFKVPRPNKGNESLSQVLYENETSIWKIDVKLDKNFILPSNETLFFEHIIQAKPREVRDINKAAKDLINDKLDPRLRVSIHRDMTDGRDILKLRLNSTDDAGQFRMLNEQILVDFNNPTRDLRGKWLKVNLSAVWSNDGRVDYSLSEYTSATETKPIVHLVQEGIDLWDNVWSEIYFKGGLYAGRVAVTDKRGKTVMKNGKIVYKTGIPTNTIYFNRIELDKR
jgi:hypothetical protein